MTDINLRLKNFKDISLDFTPHPLTNDLVMLKDNNAIKRAVMNLVLTNVGERPYNKNIGSKIRASLFDVFDYGTASDIQFQIESAIRLNEPRAELDEVYVVPNYERNEYQVTVSFTITGLDIQQTLDLYLDNLRLGAS